MANRGRPSGFHDLDLDKVEVLAVKGFTDAEMSSFFDVTEQTWNNWKKAHPDFFESLKDWKVQADSDIEKTLYERAKGYSVIQEEKTVQKVGEEGDLVLAEVTTTKKQMAPDPTSMIFWLKNRKAEWRDVRHIESNALDALADEINETSRGLPSERLKKD